nr:hypothetical protein [Kordia jejudonensis]
MTSFQGIKPTFVSVELSVIPSSLMINAALELINFTIAITSPRPKKDT